MTTDIPPPGSDEAVRLGCQCSVFTNHHGRGFAAHSGVVYDVDLDCPMHGAETMMVGKYPAPHEGRTVAMEDIRPSESDMEL